MKKILGRFVVVDWVMEKLVYEMKKGFKEGLDIKFCLLQVL